MAKDLLVRGLDNQTHSELGSVSEKIGVSLNSIVKDAVDKWLKNHLQIPKKHDLIMYANNESLLHLLKSMDGIAKNMGWFRCFCSPPTHPTAKLLGRLHWFDVTASPYNISQKNINRFFSKVIENALKAAKGKQLCLFDFVIEEYAKSSLRDAIRLESSYNSNKLNGVVFCPYQLIDIGKEMTQLIEIFDAHDQIFIVKNADIYKLHLTKENTHKLFLS